MANFGRGAQGFFEEGYIVQIERFSQSNNVCVGKTICNASLQPVKSFQIENPIILMEQLSNVREFEIKKRFQGTIFSTGHNYSFIKCGNDDLTIFFHHLAARNPNDTFKIFEVVNFRKDISYGKPRAYDVFKVAGDSKNTEQRFEGIICTEGKDYGFIKYGVDDSTIFFHYKNARYSDDTFRPSQGVSFLKQIMKGRLNAIDVFKVQDDKDYKRMQGTLIEYCHKTGKGTIEARDGAWDFSHFKFHLYDKRNILDYFKLYDNVNFRPCLYSQEKKANDVFIVHHDKEDTQALDKKTKENDEEFFSPEFIVMSPLKISKD